MGYVNVNGGSDQRNANAEDENVNGVQLSIADSFFFKSYTSRTLMFFSNDL